MLKHLGAHALEEFLGARERGHDTQELGHFAWALADAFGHDGVRECSYQSWGAASAFASLRSIRAIR
jgi:hypothetical protein